MRIAKLSTDKVVLLIRNAQEVQFDSGLWVCVSNTITTNPRRIDPYWVPASQVVWILDFGD